MVRKCVGHSWCLGLFGVISLSSAGTLPYKQTSFGLALIQIRINRALRKYSALFLACQGLLSNSLRTCSVHKTNNISCVFCILQCLWRISLLASKSSTMPGALINWHHCKPSLSWAEVPGENMPIIHTLLSLFDGLPYHCICLSHFCTCLFTGGVV